MADDVAAAYALQAAAKTPHELRCAAHALYMLGVAELSNYNFEAAGPLLEAALESLTAAGPPFVGELLDAAARLTPCLLLGNLGVVAEKQGKFLEAARFFNTAMESCDAWPEPPPEVPGDRTSAMRACFHLWQMHYAAGDTVKERARVRQYRSLLDAAGVGVPSDTDAYLRYAELALKYEPYEVDPEEMLAAARRLYPWPDWRLEPYLHSLARHAEKTGNPGRAVTLAREAVALARVSLAANTGRTCDLVDGLVCLASAHANLSSGNDNPPLAAKTAALRALTEAAACFPSLEAQMKLGFADVIWRLSILADRLGVEGVPDVRIMLYGGPARVVSLHEPDGWGIITLMEEAVRIMEALQDTQDSPCKLFYLRDLSLVCNFYRDWVGANDVAKRAAALAARVLRDSSPALADARQAASVAAANLDMILGEMRLSEGAVPDRRSVQLYTLDLVAGGGLTFPVSGRWVSPENAQEQSKLQKQQKDARLASAMKRLAARCETPCAGCGASNPEGAPAFKRCSVCHAVAYCTRECQKAHWKAKHKRECAIMAGAAAAGGAE